MGFPSVTVARPCSLGTDYFIGALHTHEQRVTLTPSQAKRLSNWLAEVGAELKLYVVRGAGVRTGLPDSEYVAAGATIIDVEDVARMEAPCCGLLIL